MGQAVALAFATAIGFDPGERASNQSFPKKRERRKNDGALKTHPEGGFPGGWD
jgi:hypothetical protein